MGGRCGTRRIIQGYEDGEDDDDDDDDDACRGVGRGRYRRLIDLGLMEEVMVGFSLCDVC